MSKKKSDSIDEIYVPVPLSVLLQGDEAVQEYIEMMADKPREFARIVGL